LFLIAVEKKVSFFWLKDCGLKKQLYICSRLEKFEPENYKFLVVIFAQKSSLTNCKDSANILFWG
jgi:hypothetical protein